MARTQARRRDTRHLRYQLNSVQSRAKMSNSSQHRELVTDTRAAGQGSK